MPGTEVSAPSSAPPAPAVQAKPRPAPAPRAPVPGPAWTDLNRSQQQALQPLAQRWNTLSDSQRRKWIALSLNFERLSAEEQAKLHSRMTDWAGLTVQQRTQARRNYTATKKIAPDDKKAQWEAYQALSLEEREKLAASARKPPAGAALAVKPVPAQKLVVVPPAAIAPKNGPVRPLPNPTLLPRPASSSPARQP